MLLFFCDQQHPVSGLQLYLDRLDPLRDEPCPALQDTPREVHRHLLPGGTGEGDAASHALAHVPQYLLGGRPAFRSRHEDAPLPVNVICGQFHRDDIAGIFDAAYQDVQAFPPDVGRAGHRAVGRYGDTSGLQGLEQAQLHPSSLLEGLALGNAGRDGVHPHPVAAAHRRVETVVPLHDK